MTTETPLFPHAAPAAEPQAAAQPATPAPPPAPSPAAAPELPFDVVATLKAGIRVRPAEFARMVGVSRSAVSEWKKSGLISVGPDGRLNPQEAARQLVQRADPSKLRAPLLRQVMESTSDAQARAAKLGAEVAALRARVAELEADRTRHAAAAVFRAEDEVARNISRLCDALVARFDEAVTARGAGRLPRWLDELVAVEFFGLDLAEYRADYPEGEEGDDSDDSDDDGSADDGSAGQHVEHSDMPAGLGAEVSAGEAADDELARLLAEAPPLPRLADMPEAGQ